MSRRIWAVATFCSAFALLHCGGTVGVVPGGGSGAAGASGHGQAGHGGHAGSSAVSRAGVGGAPLDAGFDAYHDPGCPDVGAPVEVNECDAFATNSSCPAGEGCFPFVEHPFGDGCGVQRFGAECGPAGDGRQGDDCGGMDDRCAPGFVCVVGSQPGRHCVQLCPISGPKVCPAGMICGELDVEGYGVCS